MVQPRRVLVIGATGHVGGQVVSQLASNGVAVRALARKPDTAVMPAGVEVVSGDLTVPDTLTGALDGVDAVFLTWPMLAPDIAQSVVDLIAEQANRMVLLSSAAVRDDLDEQDNPIGRAHAVIERPIMESGLEWTFLRPHGFATNTLEWAPQVRAGNVVRGAYGAASMTLLHEADIAAVAVRALLTAGHVGARYELTGSEPLSRVEQVAALGQALGRPLRWEEISPQQAEQQMDWLPAEYADFVLGGLAMMVEAPGQPTSTIHEITGSPARTYAEWAVDHTADFA
ncbi:NAD(P)H-binding protein [Nocardia uniformis]|uniref:NAD(P)H-binding protein n=1 Tax=Nocardia uniformis TaxID=53432 RepID=A0A849CJ36_9NOCA|nr:NAD(P)H-binding protein [Nocardia uniformis]NNH74151.1 NAD(P)H-binding protein [Nocardia uniformis]